MENYYIKCPVCTKYKWCWTVDKPTVGPLLIRQSLPCYFSVFWENYSKTPMVIISNISGIIGDVCS